MGTLVPNILWCPPMKYRIKLVAKGRKTGMEHVSWIKRHIADDNTEKFRTYHSKQSGTIMSFREAALVLERVNSSGAVIVVKDGEEFEVTDIRHIMVPADEV